MESSIILPSSLSLSISFLAALLPLFFLSASALIRSIFLYSFVAILQKEFFCIPFVLLGHLVDFILLFK